MEPSGGVWRALADPTRRRVLDLLRTGPQTTGALAEQFPASRFAVMKHLQVLVDAELVTVQRRGRERINCLNAVPLRTAYQRFLSPYASLYADQAAITVRAPSAHVDNRTRGDEAHPMNPTELMRGSIDLRTDSSVRASRSDVWNALMDIGDWWPHKARKESVVMLEPHIGGRFFEDWESGAALYGVITDLAENELLRVNGAMALTPPVLGVVTFGLTDDPAQRSATIVTTTHLAVGNFDSEATSREYGAGWDKVTDGLRRHLKV